jgi:tetratricopeptide (TPR) repeat protein
MKKIIRSIFFFHLLVILVVFTSSCGNNKTGELDAGFTDSVNAKYKDNLPLQEINKQILENSSADSLYRKRAALYMQLKDFELAEGDANRALKLDTMNAKNYLVLTDVYYASNQTRKAKETLERCLKNLPKDKDALLKMGELYFYVKKYQESINMINQALEVDPYLSKAYFLKGMNYMESGDTSKAVNSFLTAVEQDPDYYTAYMQLALLHYQKSNPLCLDYFDNALRINPTSTEALYGKAKYYQDYGKTKEAKEFYLRILQIDPVHKTALYNMGAIALGFDKNPEEAKKYFNQAIGADQNYTEAWFARGVAFEQLRDKKSAAENYKMALKITPNYEPAVSALNKLEKK